MAKVSRKAMGRSELQEEALGFSYYRKSTKTNQSFKSMHNGLNKRGRLGKRAAEQRKNMKELSSS